MGYTFFLFSCSVTRLESGQSFLNSILTDSFHYDIQFNRRSSMKTKKMRSKSSDKSFPTIGFFLKKNQMRSHTPKQHRSNSSNKNFFFGNFNHYYIICNSKTPNNKNKSKKHHFKFNTKNKNKIEFTFTKKKYK